MYVHIVGYRLVDGFRQPYLCRSQWTYALSRSEKSNMVDLVTRRPAAVPGVVENATLRAHRGDFVVERQRKRSVELPCSLVETKRV